jgi:CBS domain-containing protein
MAEPTVREIMDPAPATVTPETPVEEVVHALRENELTGLPVVNSSGRCVGIITEEDLVMPGDEDLHLPRYVEMFGGIVFLESMEKFEERLQRATASKARDMMTEDPVTIGPDATAREAGRTMSHVKHNRLPVVEDDGRLVGLVTRVDVLDALTRD